MKRVFGIVLCVLLLAGCSSQGDLGQVTSLRQELLSANGCTFQADITADYGDYLHVFNMVCSGDKEGNLEFTVSRPESIAGITGRITDNSANLTFNDKVLGFALLADGQFSPVSAPWILLKTLRSGYIRSIANTKQGTSIRIDDSYNDDALQVDILLDDNNLPLSAEIVWQNRRILSMKITEFTFL